MNCDLGQRNVGDDGGGVGWSAGDDLDECIPVLELARTGLQLPSAEELAIAARGIAAAAGSKLAWDFQQPVHDP